VDLSCIISSGDLELYLLGILPEDEAYKIEQLAFLFPEVRQELDRISETLEGFGRTSEFTPSAQVKKNLLGNLKRLKNEAQNSKAPAAILPIKEETTHGIVPSKKTAWLQAASIIGLIITIGVIAYFAFQNNRNKQELASLELKLNAVNRNLVEQQRQNIATAEMLNMFESDQYRKVRLTNVPGKPQAAAHVFWDTKTSVVYIADISLPHTPAHKQYQLWVIVDGKPMDAGMLDSPKKRIQKMKTFHRADAFAITLERKGGSSTPTMKEMYVIGRIS
jgi:anti-sigma-K factor RskA